MKPTIRLGVWFGVPVGLHYSWFLVAWLMTLSLANQFSLQQPGWGPATVWSLAIATAALFFVCIVLHELGHATVARLNGVPVRGITLFALGGIAQIERDTSAPSKEFWMAIAGPAVSFVIGIGSGALASAIARVAPGTDSSPVVAVLGWLGYINVGLALFNLIPAFPLDGGRVLRSIVWAVTNNADRATRIAARTGQAIAFVFIALGMYSVLIRNDFGGLWIAFIGWFLLEGAQAYYVETELKTRLRGLRVADVMTRSCAVIDANTTLDRFVNDHLLHFAAQCFAVNQGDSIVGLIAADDVKRIERDRWNTTTVAQAMRPLEQLHPVKPDMSAGDALALMATGEANQLPVVSNGHLEGVVTRSFLLQLLQLRSELHA
jgi:Zn-dependent protease/predicted transcriptional regulator